MKWKWYHAVRLKKLADFLHNLKEEKFDFKDWVSEQKNDCGTVCCALGWMPAVDKRWKWIPDFNGSKLIPNYRNLFLDEGSEEYFGLSYDECWGLFIPESQEYIKYKNLDSNSTPKRVARMYYNFIKRKEKLRVAGKK